MMDITSRNYKSIWLRTLDAVPDAERINFTFNDLPLIQIRGKAVLKVNSVSIGGEAQTDLAEHNITVKIDNVQYNRLFYFNSDKNSIPTIANFDYSTRNTIQNNAPVLILEEQDINQIKLQIFTDSQGTGDASHGLVKNSKNGELFINLIIEEYSE